jgi:hypothetical protein
MTAKGSYKTIILFEDEVRAAAKACSALRNLPAGAPDEEFQAAARAVLDACIVALDGAEDDAACVLLGRKPASFLDQEPS